MTRLVVENLGVVYNKGTLWLTLDTTSKGRLLPLARPVEVENLPTGYSVQGSVPAGTFGLYSHLSTTLKKPARPLLNHLINLVRRLEDPKAGPLMNCLLPWPHVEPPCVLILDAVWPQAFGQKTGIAPIPQQAMSPKLPSLTNLQALSIAGLHDRDIGQILQLSRLPRRRSLILLGRGIEASMLPTSLQVAGNPEVQDCLRFWLAADKELWLWLLHELAEEVVSAPFLDKDPLEVYHHWRANPAAFIKEVLYGKLGLR